MGRVWDKLRGKGKGKGKDVPPGERAEFDPSRDVLLDPGADMAERYGMGAYSEQYYKFMGEAKAAMKEGRFDEFMNQHRAADDFPDEVRDLGPDEFEVRATQAAEGDTEAARQGGVVFDEDGNILVTQTRTRRTGTGDALDTPEPRAAGTGEAVDTPEPKPVGSFDELALEEARGIHATGETGLETSSTMRQGQRGILSEIENINGEITAAQSAVAAAKGKAVQTAAKRVTKLETERQALVDSLDTEGTRLLEQSEAELGREARQGARALVSIEEEAGALKKQLAEAGKARGKAHEGLPERPRETKGLGKDEIAELDRRVANNEVLTRAMQINQEARGKAGGDKLKELFDEKRSLQEALDENKVPKTHAELEEAVGEQLPHEVEWGGKTFTSEREPPPKVFRLEKEEVAEAVKSRPSMKDHPQVKAELEVRRIEKRAETVERARKRAQAKVERGAQAQRGREAEAPVKTRAPKTKQAPGKDRRYQKARQRQELEKTRKASDEMDAAEKGKLIKAKRREVKDLQKAIDDNAPSVRDEPKAQIEKDIKTREAKRRLTEVRKEIRALEGKESKLALERRKAYKAKLEGKTLTERQKGVIEESVDDLKLELSQKYAKDKMAAEDAELAARRQREKVKQLKKKLEEQKKAGC